MFTVIESNVVNFVNKLYLYDYKKTFQYVFTDNLIIIFEKNLQNHPLSLSLDNNNETDGNK